jgi:hypothetical protein
MALIQQALSNWLFLRSRENLAPSPIGQGSVVNNPAFMPRLILDPIERGTNREEVKGGFSLGASRTVLLFSLPVGWFRGARQLIRRLFPHLGKVRTPVSL